MSGKAPTIVSGANTPSELSGGIIVVNGHKRTVPLS